MSPLIYDTKVWSRTVRPPRTPATSAPWIKNPNLFILPKHLQIIGGDSGNDDDFSLGRTDGVGGFIYVTIYGE